MSTILVIYAVSFRPHFTVLAVGQDIIVNISIPLEDVLEIFILMSLPNPLL